MGGGVFLFFFNKIGVLRLNCCGFNPQFYYLKEQSDERESYDNSLIKRDIDSLKGSVAVAAGPSHILLPATIRQISPPTRLSQGIFHGHSPFPLV